MSKQDRTSGAQGGESAPPGIQPAMQQIERGARAWCKRQGRRPHHQLRAAAMLWAGALAAVAKSGTGEPAAQDAQRWAQAAINRVGADVREDVRAAYDQLMEYLASLPHGTPAGSEVESEPSPPEDVIKAESRRLVALKLVEGVQNWCTATGKAPRPMLQEAAELALAASGFGQQQGATDEERAKAAGLHAAQMLLELSQEKQNQMLEAVEQVREFIATFKTGDDMARELGFQA